MARTTARQTTVMIWMTCCDLRAVTCRHHRAVLLMVLGCIDLSLRCQSNFRLRNVAANGEPLIASLHGVSASGPRHLRELECVLHERISVKARPKGDLRRQC